MLGRISLVLGLALMLSLGNSASAQDVPVAPPIAFWQATYWNNKSLSGDFAVQQEERQLNYDWGNRSPHPSVNADNFSVRWERYPMFSDAIYRFTAMSDDGIRVWVDNRLLIDGWYDHPAQAYHADQYLSKGNHVIRVEYYENTGRAIAQVSWMPLPVESRAWHGEYYSNPWLSGLPTLVRSDLYLNFHWGYGSPAAGIPGDSFSVRWAREVTFEPGVYRFTTTTDDGVRLWVGGQLLIDRWVDQPLRSHSAATYLAGLVMIRMEYYESQGVAGAQLTWVHEDAVPPPETVVVDDVAPGFVRGGASRYWYTAAEGWGGNMIWTRNNDWPRYDYNWARWYPELEPAWYEVFAHIPTHYATSARARYWISHADGFALRVVNQAEKGGRWISLGTYRFGGARSNYVSLADVTYEPYLSTLLGFDAVKWERR